METKLNPPSLVGLSELYRNSTLTNELILLTDSADTVSSMAVLVSRSDIENPADFNKYSGWFKDATKALAEILKEHGQFHRHMLAVAQVIDRQINASTIH